MKIICREISYSKILSHFIQLNNFKLVLSTFLFFKLDSFDFISKFIKFTYVEFNQNFQNQQQINTNPIWLSKSISYHYNLNEIFNQAYFVTNPIQPLTQHHPDQFTTDELLVLLDIHDTYHEYYEFQSNLMHTEKRVTMMRRIREKNGILNSNNETTLKKDDY